MHNQEIYDLEQDLEKIYMSLGLGQGGVTLQKQAWTSLDKLGQVWTRLDKFGQVWTTQKFMIWNMN